MRPRSVAALTFVVAAVVVLTGAAATTAGAVLPGGLRPSVTLFDRPADGLESVLARGDGQTFAALAQDPTLARPEVFRGPPAEAAYRAQRPLLGWLAWALSGGQPDRVPWRWPSSPRSVPARSAAWSPPSSSGAGAHRSGAWP